MGVKRTQKTTIMKRKIFILSAAAVCILSAAAVLTGCNVTRTITTQSQYYQRGDTTCTIVTKTIETYDASKKL